LLIVFPFGNYEAVNLGNCLYLYQDSCLAIYDITNLGLPVPVTKVRVPGRNGRLFVRGSYLYLATGYDHSLQIIEITDPQNPILRGSLNLSANTIGLYVVDTLCYIANANLGLRIISVANPDIPYELGNYNTPGISYDVVVFDTLAIVADGDAGVVILNVRIPSNPTLISVYDTRVVHGG